MTTITNIEATAFSTTKATKKAGGTNAKDINIPIEQSGGEEPQKLSKKEIHKNIQADLKSGKLKLVSDKRVLGFIPVPPHFEYTCSKDEKGRVKEKFVDVLARYGIDPKEKAMKAQYDAHCTSGVSYDKYKTETVKIPTEYINLNEPK